MQKFIQKYHHLFNVYLVIISFLLFMFFILIVLPNEAAKSVLYGLNVSPDTSFFYTRSTLYEIAENYGILGRRFYIHQRLTFDLLWPIAYGLFLFTTSVYLLIRLKFSAVFSKLLWFSIFAVIFDYIENISTSIVMYRFPNETFFFDSFAGITTMLKWVMIMLAFINLIFLLSTYIYQKIKKK